MLFNFFLIIFTLIFIISCKNEITDNNVIIKKEKIIEIKNYPFYLVDEPYFIEGIEYTPKEDYQYSEIGQASFFDKNYHGKKTKNNEVISIIELIAAHKTLPLPSVVRITNIENNTALIVRINDRGPMNNTDIIMVSRKVAQLLGFFKNKTTQVKVEILEEESKQLKSVAESINTELSLETIKAAPTGIVNISNID